MKPKILLIAPHNHIAEPFRAALEKHGFAVTVADSSPLQSRSPHTEHFALVVNLRQNGRHEIGDAAIGSHFIDAAFLSPNRAFPGSIKLFRNGVYRLGAAEGQADGADVDKFVDTVRERLERNASCQHDQSNPAAAGGDPDSAGQPALSGQSSQIEEVRQLIKRISQFPGMPVLITGETGAGKEVVANLLHASSPRADKPLIKVNCSTLTEPLFESQLFGHRKGAFTGAHDTQKGLVEAAKGGTLFLDELSTLKLELQPKLLRLLEDGGYLPVGETVERRTNAWIIVASNESLAELVRQKMFRADLYYPLKDIEINMPPLRERSMDILPLAAHFLAQFSQEFGRQSQMLSPEAQSALLQYHWPGNVRELKNIMRKAIIYGQGNIIGAEHLVMETAEQPVSRASVVAKKTLREAERDHILAVFKNSGCKIRATAQLLGIDRNTLRKKLFEYRIRFKNIRDG